MEQDKKPGGLSPNLTDADTERRVLVARLQGFWPDDGLMAALFPSLPPAIVRAVLALPPGSALAGLVESLDPAAIKSLGGLQRLVEFIDNTLPIVTPGDGERLRALAERRRLYQDSISLARDALSESMTAEQLRVKAGDLATMLPERVSARQTSWGLNELLTAHFPPKKWIVQGLLPTGLTFLAGRPKCGKSFLALQLAVAVAGGTAFLDRDTHEGCVLYIALEDSAPRLQERLQRWGVDASLPVQIELSWPSLVGVGFDQMLRTVEEMRPALVIVDTVSRAFANSGGRLDWNDQSDAIRVLAPLQTAALERDLAILCIDHTRKPSGLISTPLDDLIGSTGKSGVLDTSLSLRREPLNGKGTLALQGRDVEEHELSLQWDATICTWQIMGDARQLAAQEAIDEVLAGLRLLGGSADAGAVGREIGKSRIAARNHLESLSSTGRVSRAIIGDRGQVVYSLVDMEENDL